jgi:ribosomal protein L28
MFDMKIKKRSFKPTGEKNPKAVLTEGDVKKIRISNETTLTLGERYGVDHTTISAVKNNKTWRHICR